MRQVFVLNDTAITEIYTLSLHDALPISTVGSVIPTEQAIIPAAVGVDIGCGMMAVRTQFDAAHLAGKDLSVDRKSTRLNSSHANISYAVFCLKKNQLPRL